MSSHWFWKWFWEKIPPLSHTHTHSTNLLSFWSVKVPSFNKNSIFSYVKIVPSSAGNTYFFSSSYVNTIPTATRSSDSFAMTRSSQFLWLKWLEGRRSLQNIGTHLADFKIHWIFCLSLTVPIHHRQNVVATWGCAPPWSLNEMFCK